MLLLLDVYSVYCNDYIKCSNANFNTNSKVCVMGNNLFKSFFVSGLGIVVYHLLNRNPNSNHSNKYVESQVGDNHTRNNPKIKKIKPKRLSESDVVEIQELRTYLDTTTIPPHKKDDIIKHRIHSMKFPNTKAKRVGVVFHGSQRDFDDLTLIPHYHSNGKPVVFGALSKGFSLAFLSNWTDDDFELASINNGPLFLRELRPNALKDTFKGKSGWLYTLDAKPFKSFRHLMKYEMISFVKPKIIKKEYIQDVLVALENCKDIVLIPYGKKISDYV